MLGKIEGRRRRRLTRTGWLDGTTDSMVMSLSKLEDGEGQGSLACCSPRGQKPGMLQSMGLQRVQHDLVTDNYKGCK